MGTTNGLNNQGNPNNATTNALYQFLKNKHLNNDFDRRSSNDTSIGSKD
jgi:hypothetical protein